MPATSTTAVLSIGGRMLDALLPFRRRRKRREYEALMAQIALLEAQIDRIQRTRVEYSVVDAALPQSERSIILLRGQLTGDDLTQKQRQLKQLQDQASQVEKRYPELDARKS